MKKYLFFTMLATAAVAFSTTFGCKKNTDPTPHILGSPDTVFVKMGETVQIFAGDFSIRLDSVIGESRCPSNVECFWAGRVDARFLITKNGIVATDTLALGAIDAANFPDDKTNRFGFKIQLIEMFPYPEDPGTIPQSEYTARLAVLPE